MKARSQSSSTLTRRFKGSSRKHPAERWSRTSGANSAARDSLSAMDCGGRAARAQKRRDAAAAAAEGRETMASMTNAFASAKMKIRKARRGDAERIARLSGELGYPASAAQVATRLRQLTPVSKHAVFVAESPDAATGVVGWVHVSVAHLLESDIRAEVNGLVVAEGQRSAGAG